MKLHIGCDHAAYDAKTKLIEFLKEKGLEINDLGTNSEERCNYPDYASTVAKAVANEEGKGILLCGSGIGVSMVANRYQKIRAALCCTKEQAVLSRQHNDSNILCVGARLNTTKEIEGIVEAWLATDFEEGRHSERVALFNNLGEKVS